MRKSVWILFTLMSVCGTATWAQEPAQQPADPTAEVATLDEVVVSGVLPGPGLWRISKDDHVLWVLGVMEPLPRRMQWDSTKVEARIAQSQEVLMEPMARVKADIGFFGGLMLLPKALAARRNPEKETLAQVVPAELYARWSVLKQVYFKRNRGIEKQRPIVAASKLYDRALSRAGLSERDRVSKVVRKAAKRNKLTITEPTLELEIADPKQALAEFAANGLNDLPCFAQTLDRVESDLGAMKARANAWATGDVEALRQLPFVDQRRACVDALLNAQFARDRGLDDLRQRLRMLWLDAAVSALERNTSSFAILGIHELLRADGLAAQLAARGYEVQAP
jgi:uncharacterized protein YbaP (TraB family)